MKLSEWARRNDVHYRTAWQWAKNGKMPVTVVTAATGTGLTIAGVVSEVGSGLDGKHPKLARRRRDASVTGIVVERRDRPARFGLEHVSATPEATGRRIVVIDGEAATTVVDGDLMREMTEVLSSVCAHLYGCRSASRRAKAARRAIREAA
ncbi:recombinase family protein [Nonomuraea sp. NPDC005650]|uniref:recombinase family protein n=1 Tax=Nonomuraea sp. NPDC005650 TaxID=3157045 RepID=UPI0033BA4969